MTIIGRREECRQAGAEAFDQPVRTVVTVGVATTDRGTSVTSRLETIAHTRFGDEVARMGWIIFQLASQSRKDGA